MEKECSLACVKKHMTIYQEILKWKSWLSMWLNSLLFCC
jgi:hypothetical protein